MNPVYGSFLKTSGEIVSEEKINNDEDKNTSLGTVSALLTREEALAKVQAILKKRPPPVSPLPMPIHIENLPQTLDPVSLRDKPQIDPFSSNSNDVGLIQMMERMRNAEIREPFADTVLDWRSIVDDLEASMKVIDRRTKRKKSLNENSYRMLYYWAIEHLIDILLSRISQNIGHHHYTTLTSSSGSSNAQALLAQVVMLREKSRNCFDSSCEEAPLARWSLTRLTDKITR